MTGFTTPPSTTCSAIIMVGLLSLLDGIYQDSRSNTLFKLNGTRIIPVLVPYCFTIKLVNYGYDRESLLYRTINNNDALVAALASKNNCDPMAMAAMMNQNDYMNNPFAYLIWMIFAMRMWNNQDGNPGNAIQSQLDAMRSQIAGNQNSSLVMDAIRGNANAITQLASNLNCDFNALNNAICCVRSGIQEVAGNVNFSAERVINAINLGDANLTSALQNCCCQTQQNIIKMGYENQLGQKDIVNQMQTGFSQTNSGLERAASNLGFQMSQIACDLKTNANANTQRIVDVLNNHWQSDLQQRYNDARLELSQQKQNATLIAALKTTTAA